MVEENPRRSIKFIHWRGYYENNLYFWHSLKLFSKSRGKDAWCRCILWRLYAIGLWGKSHYFRNSHFQGQENSSLAPSLECSWNNILGTLSGGRSSLNHESRMNQYLIIFYYLFLITTITFPYIIIIFRNVRSWAEPSSNPLKSIRKLESSLYRL